MPAGSLRELPVNAFPLFRSRTGVDTEDPMDERSVRLRTTGSGAHVSYDLSASEEAPQGFSIGVLTRFPHSVQDPS